MVDKIGGLGFLDNFHCEKTKFLLFAFITGFVILGYGLFTNKFIPEITINNEPISYFLIAGILVIAGYLGVIYYKVMNGKKLDAEGILFFWKDE